MATKKMMQQTLNENGMEHITVVNKNNVKTHVDGEETTFERSDELWMSNGSGLATFGSVAGDWRMIQAISEDITHAFGLIKS
jgi:hypothetical protein